MTGRATKRREHPIVIEPTSHPIEATSRDRTRLGFACAWWHPREPTWSYVASPMRAALGSWADVIDLDAQRRLPGKVLLRALCGPLRGVPWQYSAVERRLRDRAVRRGVDRGQPDAVLAIADVDTPTAVPTFLYQDWNLAADLAVEEEMGVPTNNMLPSSNVLRARRGEDQLSRARAVAGVFAMSGWYRDFLIKHGVEPERVTVTGCAINNPAAPCRDVSRPSTGRLLFIGTHFRRKGGDLVVEAVRRLRAAGDRPITLTIVGPRSWPLAGGVPAFVDFRGDRGPRADPVLYADHDLYVMPSRVEAYGIPFAEALVAGLPCVGLRRFAMPEIIEPGITGELVDSEDADELAAAIDRVLADRDAHARVARRREVLLERHDWRNVAGRMVARIEDQLGRRST